MKLSDYVISRIAEHVDTVFFVPGGGCMHLVESLGNSKMRHVSCLHEQGAAFAAAAYGAYWIDKKFGVVLTTSGPGATNTITPVIAAVDDGYPLIIISGQVKTDTLMKDLGLRSFGSQEVNIIRIMEHDVKYSKLVLNPEDIKDVMNHAIAHAINGRQGPVWIDIPLDIQAREI